MLDFLNIQMIFELDNYMNELLEKYNVELDDWNWMIIIDEDPDTFLWKGTNENSWYPTIAKFDLFINMFSDIKYYKIEYQGKKQVLVVSYH